MTHYRTGTHSPVNIWCCVDGEPDVQVAMARNDHMATELVRAANAGLETELRLSGTVPYPTGAEVERAERFLPPRQSHTAPLDGCE